MAQVLEFAIQQADIMEFAADVVALKYAQEFYGADRAIAERLVQAKVASQADLQPAAGEYRYLESKGCIDAGAILFVGVRDLSQLRYPQIRELASRTLAILVKEAEHTQHLAMT